MLVAELESPGLALVFDKRVMHLGDSLMKIFEEIGTVDYLLVVLSSHSVQSKWVKAELATAIMRQIEEPDFKVIPIVKDACDVPVGVRQALRDRYQARFDTRDRDEVTKELLEALSTPNDPRRVYSEFQGPASDNPFRRVRAEHFENISVLGRSYSEPEAARYERIVETKPVILEGGRGTGKTMTLKSMLPQAAVSRLLCARFEETNLRYFAVYLRCVPGSFATQSGAIEEIVGANRCTALFLSEMVLKLAMALVNELKACTANGILQTTSSRERQLVSDVVNAVRPSDQEGSQPQDFEGLRIYLTRELRFITDYLRRRVFGEVVSYDGVFLGIDELRHICCTTVDSYWGNRSTTIYWLLDEFENLLAFQKVVVNSILKASEAGYFSVKAATKKATFTTPKTLEGQEVEEPHDYSLVDVDYNISDEQERKNYRELLTTICSRILTQEQFTQTDIVQLLETAPEWDGLEKRELEQEIAATVGRRTLRAEDWHRLGVTAIYRVLHRKRGGRKQFAGFDDLLTLSSGVIRIFLELAGLSYHFAVQEGRRVKQGEQIGIQHQSDAAYALSNYYLTTIRNNVATLGPQIQQLVIDLGDIFRARLLHHKSEPEGSRLALHDPQRLEDKANAKVKEVLTQALIHSVLQNPGRRGGMRPKHTSDVQPQEYVLNRVYSPSLAISPRTRWRTRIGTNDLRELLDPELRQIAKSRLTRFATTAQTEAIQHVMPLEDG
jgi:hypothetical protein